MAGLTHKKIVNAKPGRHFDGKGLYLLVSPTGGKSWVLRVMFNGRRREYGLGSFDDLSLTEAREKCAELRKIARAGGDVIAARDGGGDEPAPSFREAAIACHAAKAPGWSDKNAASFLSSLELHAYPLIGSTPVDDINERDLAAVLGPLWVDRPAIAKKVRARVGLVLNFAKAHGWREHGAPRESLSTLLPKAQPEGNFSSMPYEDVPAFVARLDAKRETASTLALLLQIFTASRHGEVRSAMWSHFDLTNALWHRPAELMKGDEAHTVTLSPQALAILERAKALRVGQGDCLVFPNRKGERLTDNALSKIVRPTGFTAHGFRSSFRTWAAEHMPSIPEAVAEKALAHKIPVAVERAYNRAKFLEMRRTLLDAWGRYVGGESAKVVQLPLGLAG